MKDTRSGRNKNVEEAVDLFIDLFDRLVHGETLGPPTPRKIKQIFDSHAQKHGGSVRLACVFLTAYAVQDRDWSFTGVPVGTRGKYGDKKLASALTLRHATFHNSITAFGENLGWKGNVKNFDLSKDDRFWPYLAKVQALTLSQRRSLLQHIAWVFFSTRVVPVALPPLPDSYLSFARSLSLCERLMAIKSEGHIQQFLVAAFLQAHRSRFGHRVETHHPHASDKFDGTYGDIEEFRENELVAAYEVTVRDDWKNRLADFGKKTVAGNLKKYVIFAADVRSDPELCPAEQLIDFVEHLPYDLAVVDLRDFFSVFCAELTRDEIKRAFNLTYEFLCEPSLCGRNDFQQSYLDVTDEWLEQ